ncbi:hypothetical protein BDV59DRAFT_63761 [Aspergillus ambiguus]|uniref:uncharacterized protein n=1 Tax=Aspergillus ambiguus TaxID=176160 RepID=UPI003CCD0134
MDTSNERPPKCQLDSTRPPNYQMTFTRYKEPLPKGVLFLDTNQDMRAAVDSFQKAGSDTYFDEVNGGYYMMEVGGKVVGVTSDAMCEELDRRQAHAERFMAENERRERAGLPPLGACSGCGGCSDAEEGD